MMMVDKELEDFQSSLRMFDLLVKLKLSYHNKRSTLHIVSTNGYYKEKVLLIEIKDNNYFFLSGLQHI
ncbi:hypothetical protein AB3S75_027031 [Citrus x aurantiifolia]